MFKVRIENQLTAAPEQVWQVLRTFSLAYFKGYPHTVTGQGVGTERRFELPDGEMVERIIAIDEAERSLSYVIVKGPWPVTDYTANIQVRESETGSLVTWSAEFHAGADPESTAEMIAKTFKTNLRAIEKYLSA